MAMGRLMPTMKHAAYLSSKFSDAIMNLPLRFGGYGVRDVSKEMVFQQVRMFLSAYRSGGNTGVKVRALLEYHQLESGGKQSILEGNGSRDYLLTKSWLTVLVSRLRKMGLWIRAEHWVPDEEAGETLMDYMVGREENMEVLKKFNMCRMHYGVVCKDEVYSMEGRLCLSNEEFGQTRTLLK